MAFLCSSPQIVPCVLFSAQLILDVKLYIEQESTLDPFGAGRKATLVFTHCMATNCQKNNEKILQCVEFATSKNCRGIIFEYVWDLCILQSINSTL